MKKYEAYTNRSNYGKIRVVVTEDGDIFYSATDVARAMGYRSPRDAVQTHCEHIQTFYHRAGAGFQSMNFIYWMEVPYLAIGMPTERALNVYRWLFKELPPAIQGILAGKYSRSGLLKREGVFYQADKDDNMETNLNTITLILDQALESKAKKGGGAHGRTPAVHEG